MSSLISIHYLLQFLIFIFIIPISSTIGTELQLLFVNGFNVIRCSDKQVQIYQPINMHSVQLDLITVCENKANIYNKDYAGFIWLELALECSSDASEVHEEQYIVREVNKHPTIQQPSEAKGQVAGSDEAYELHIESNDGGEHVTIKSNDQPANDEYFTQDSRTRTIYIWFPDHPMICRIKFIGHEDIPCSSGNKNKVKDSTYVCYYDPSADKEITIEEMEAELEDIEEAEKPADSIAYLLDLDRPIFEDDDSADGVDTDGNNPSNPNPTNSNSSNSSISNKKGKKRRIHPQKKPKDKNSSAMKIIGIVFGILLLISLIGGVAFYFIRKHRSNQSSLLSSSSINIENENNQGLSPVASNESEKSLANDVDQTTREKPNIALQTSVGNKRQRTGASMTFNNDI